MKKFLFLLLAVCFAVGLATTLKADPSASFKEVFGQHEISALAVIGMAIPTTHPVIVRFSGSENDTLGALYLDGQFQHYTIEDEYRPQGQKVRGETRIPAGTYPLSLNTWGSFHQTYGKKYPDMHEGMIMLNKVPGFEGILYHPGNTDADTMGCILPGDSANNNQIGRGQVGLSQQAYARTYPKLLAYMKANPGEAVIEIIDQDRQTV